MDNTRRENIQAAMRKCATEVERLHNEGYLVGKLLKFPGSVDSLICNLVSETQGASYTFGIVLSYDVKGGFDMKCTLLTKTDTFNDFLYKMKECMDVDASNRKTILEWFSFCALKLSPLCMAD